MQEKSRERLDFRSLRPRELAFLLNSTPLGTVIDERQLSNQRIRAGFKIGEGKRIDFIRYARWVMEQLRASPAQRKSQEEAYALHKKESARRMREISLAGREIGKVPEVVNQERRARGLGSLEAFCKEYFPLTFNLAWSDDHRRVLARLEQVVRKGGLFALAMPRGSGKTSICERACLWALFTGMRRFVVLIGSDVNAATEMMDTIKTELALNELLFDDFPEIVHPIRALEGIPQRCTGQICGGQPTNMAWTDDAVILPSVAGSAASGAILKVTGITGRIHGMKHVTPAGDTLRPDLVIVDDPQTDESARSVVMTQSREAILMGAVLGLAGPGKRIACVMPCTVMYEDDLADRLLNRERHPEWQGERMKMVYEFPKAEKLWAEYADILAASLRNDEDGTRATEFYRQHQEEMDKGARVAWPERHDAEELSAVQNAMNLRARDPRSFWAEFQNDPQPDEAVVLGCRKAEEVMAKVNNRPRMEVPAGAEFLTAQIDVHENLLFYAVCAWHRDFTGYLVDYGTEPRQPAAYFTVDQIDRTLRRSHPGRGPEGAIYRGLEVLTGDILGKEWGREDGAIMRISLCLIDQGWETGLIHKFCRQSPFAALLIPSRGYGVTAGQKPIIDYDRKRGDRIGHHWWIPAIKVQRALRHIEVDTNFWKSFLHAHLGLAQGERGCISIFGKHPDQHRLFADHVCAEYPVRTTGHGRTVDEWKSPPKRPDNHWLDCFVGCCAAASMLGAATVDLGMAIERKRVSFREQQQQRRAQRDADRSRRQIRETAGRR